MKFSLKTALFLIALFAICRASIADWDAANTAYDKGNYKLAFVEYEIMAKRGDAKAQFILGDMHRKGEGTFKDLREAAKWVQLAAEQDFAIAQSNLGVMYALGRGVPKDYVRAYAWSNLAAAQGNESAKKTRDLVSKLMTSSQIDRAQQLASELYEKNIALRYGEQNLKELFTCKPCDLLESRSSQARSLFLLLAVTGP